MFEVRPINWSPCYRVLLWGIWSPTIRNWSPAIHYWSPAVCYWSPAIRNWSPAYWGSVERRLVAYTAVFQAWKLYDHLPQHSMQLHQRNYLFREIPVILPLELAIVLVTPSESTKNLKMHLRSRTSPHVVFASSLSWLILSTIVIFNK